jgi:peptidoglycan hydrolase-like protein with peptidoglycan-binding domain
MPARRRLLVSLAAAVVVAAGAGIGISVADTSGERGDDTAPAYRGATSEVVRGDLEGSTTASGTLRFAEERTIQSARGGIVTETPTPGSVEKLGDRLYAVDNIPVFLLRGAMPAWRDLGAGMTDGPDVRQLEQSLRDLGFFTGQPDDRFSSATADATKKWQKAVGLDRTGRLPLGSVVFTGGDLRVGTVTAHVGDQVGPGTGLFGTTSTTQVVDVNLKLADQQLAVVGTKVSLRLPGGTETTGTISSVGTPTENENANGQNETVIPMVVALDDPAAATSFQEASVTVDVPSERRENVLSVPVGALVAIDQDRFGVEVVEADGTTRKVSVTTGLFAGGRVEISGADVEEGQRVVVPR